MQWMADGIHDFIATDHQKNPLEELIIVVLQIAGTPSDILRRDDQVVFFFN